MKRLLNGTALTALVFIVLLAAVPPAMAAEPERLTRPVFSVIVADERGDERSAYSDQSPPYLDIQFTLSLSASDQYSTTFTVIQTADGDVKEETLFKGSLSEGHYRFLAPIGNPPTAKGPVGVKLIMKTRVFAKKFSGESYYVYQRWEGSYNAGR